MVAQDAFGLSPAKGPSTAKDATVAFYVEPDASAALSALDLLAHLWSRPVADEVECWKGVAELEEHLARVLPVRVARLSPLVEPAEMLEEYERLFVGPGPVPCSPYESFWREDVPVDIRRSLMGPCTADLRRLYGELGLELSPVTGELPDHVGVELEALTYALSSRGGGEVARELFFDHLRAFLPRLSRAVLHEAEHPFYLELARATLSWLGPLERCLEAVLPSRPTGT